MWGEYISLFQFSFPLLLERLIIFLNAVQAPYFFSHRFVAALSISWRVNLPLLYFLLSKACLSTSLATYFTIKSVKPQTVYLFHYGFWVLFATYKGFILIKYSSIVFFLIFLWFGLLHLNFIPSGIDSCERSMNPSFLSPNWLASCPHHLLNNISLASD